MKLRDRMSQGLSVRSAGKIVTCGRPPSGLALSSAPLFVSPLPRRQCETIVTLLGLLQWHPPGPALPIESP